VTCFSQYPDSEAVQAKRFNRPTARSYTGTLLLHPCEGAKPRAENLASGQGHGVKPCFPKNLPHPPRFLTSRHSYACMVFPLQVFFPYRCFAACLFTFVVIFTYCWGCGWIPQRKTNVAMHNVLCLVKHRLHNPEVRTVYMQEERMSGPAPTPPSCTDLLIVALLPLLWVLVLGSLATPPPLIPWRGE
jgi:hypothetical protein